MIASLCQALNTVSLAPYGDKRYGLAFDYSSEVSGKRVTFPFEHGSESCTRDNAIIPDARYRMLSWWEHSGDIRSSKLEGRAVHTASLSLVAWVNTKKISADPLISDKIMRDIMRKYEVARVISHTSGASVLKVRVTGARPRAKEILSKYSFDDASKLISHPYDIFRVNMEVDFVYECAEIEMEEQC